MDAEMGDKKTQQQWPMPPIHFVHSSTYGTFSISHRGSDCSSQRGDIDRDSWRSRCLYLVSHLWNLKAKRAKLNRWIEDYKWSILFFLCLQTQRYRLWCIHRGQRTSSGRVSWLIWLFCLCPFSSCSWSISSFSWSRDWNRSRSLFQRAPPWAPTHTSRRYTDNTFLESSKAHRTIQRWIWYRVISERAGRVRQWNGQRQYLSHNTKERK